MKEGLLWFDNDPKRKLADKVSRAATRYQAKLHRKPTVCYLSADQFDGNMDEIDGIHLKPASNLQPNYFLVGVEQDSALAKAA